MYLNSLVFKQNDRHIEYKGLVVYMYLKAGKWFPYDDPDKFAEDYKNGLKVYQ